MFRPFFARLSASIARRNGGPVRLHANRDERFMEALSRLYSQGVGRGF